MTVVADNVLLFETRAPGFGPDDLVVRWLHGFEEISTPYEIELILECTIDGGLSPEEIDELLNARACVGLGPHGSRKLHGVLSEIELSTMAPDAKWSTYRAVLVPRLWLTTLTHRSRCFVETTIPDVIRAVLRDSGLTEGTDFELRIHEGEYPSNQDRHVVQYDETDFNFLSRWMERLGIFYFFEQGDSGEKLVIADANAEAVEVPEQADVAFSSLEDISVVGALYDLRRRTRKRPAKVHVRDYNWRASAKTHLVHGESDADESAGFGLQAHYGDHLDSDATGASRARVRAEAWMAQKNVYAARTANYHFAPGHTFTLSGAPMGELDHEYLLVRVEHHADQERRAPGSGDYRNDVEAIERAVPYRPPRRAYWPRIDGIMHAKIDAGDATSAAPIDDKGRYRVLLPYDLYGRFGSKPSRWIRKAEAYSGPQYGAHFTLHVGAEVLLAHIDGDPDRPIIVGTVANDRMMNPMTDQNPTRSAIRTRSGIFIDFEDDA